MATGAPISKEPAGTLPFAGVQASCMGIVFAAECRFKSRKLDTLRLLCILFGLGDLSDHTGVHWSLSLSFLSRLALGSPVACCLLPRATTHIHEIVLL